MNLRILLIEDNPGDVRLLQLMLNEALAGESELTVCARVSDALAHMAEPRRFDVILSDLSLPDSHGLDTFQKICVGASGTPVIVLTSLNDEAMAMRAVQEGAQDYLVKGEVTGGALARAIRYAIQRQETSHYRALIAEREHLDAAISQMSDGIIVTDGQWQVTAANHAAHMLLNLPDDGGRGMPLEQALSPFECSVAPAELRTGGERLTRLQISRANTRPPLFLDAVVTRLFDPAGRLASVVLALRDVTAERQAQALQANFFSLVSHKLRTPLTVLWGYLELMKRLPPADAAEELPSMLEIYETELKRLREIVQRLLDFKASGPVQDEVGRQETPLRPAVASAIERVRREFPAKTIEVTQQFADGITAVAVPPEHLEIILHNVLGNAVKFADKEVAQVRVGIERGNGGLLRFAVSDNGPGIPHEYFDRILEGFVQVEASVTGQVAGLGVGLVLARRVVEAHGGTLAIRSMIGQGATISWTLPAA